MTSNALDRFFHFYYSSQPVNATFTGVHQYDALLPDWSAAGLETQHAAAGMLLQDLEREYPVHEPERAQSDPSAIDAELARGYLETRLAEDASSHGVMGNPALWTGEAVFSIIALMIRDFAPLEQRVASAQQRLEAIPYFFERARATLGERPIPQSWTARALRECEGARILLTRGMARWTASAPAFRREGRFDETTAAALAAFAQFADWLTHRPAAADEAMRCGAESFDLLLARAHHCGRSRADILREARERFEEARAALDLMSAGVAGSLPAAQELIAEQHPAPADYLSAFGRVWQRCHEVATTHDVVTWPEWPIRYTLQPEWTRDAAPFLYYLPYRSPAPFDPYSTYDYVVPPLPAGSEEAHLRVWNDSAVCLNHVVHHGAIGHHVQNWHAYHRATSRIGKIAAVDCASRIGMLCGGTMAEGWACYVCDLMEELGFLSELERVAQQHTRVRLLARAIVDIELHQGTMSFDDAVRFYAERVPMSGDAARGEAVKNSMFPCTAVMYALGVWGIHELRQSTRRLWGPSWTLKAFHDALLAQGAVPVALAARRLLAPARSA